MGDVSSFANEYGAAGLSVIPIRADGSKAPAWPTWKEHQTRLATPEERLRMFRGHVGIAIIAGSVSGGLEVLDFDEPGLLAQFVELVEAERPGLISRLPHARSPKNGDHLYWRCKSPEGNQKLAMRVIETDGPEEVEIDGKRHKPRQINGCWFVELVLIETRGEGGYILAPGCPPECHETRRLYSHVSGPAIRDVPTITIEERRMLLNIARRFDERVPEPIHETKVENNGKHSRLGLAPGDDFNERATWDEILTPHGWAVEFRRGNIAHWRRPGKTRGTSATTGLRSNEGNELFCVFSTNAYPFEGPRNGSPCTPYAKFGAYALLNHNGDFSQAAKALARQGYGSGNTSRVARHETANPRSDRPVIYVTCDEEAVTDQAIDALSQRSDLYQRAGSLVHVVEEAEPPHGIDRPKNAPRIVPLPLPRLREMLSSAAEWRQAHKEDFSRVHPPLWAVQAVEARGQWSGVNPIEAIVETPVLRPDGTVLQTPGYDRLTGILYRPKEQIPAIADNPTIDDARGAAELLLEVVADFPFAVESHRAAWLAAVLTPAMRHAINGCVPLTAIDANMRGAGKSLLVDSISTIYTGNKMARTTNPRDDEEFRKRITSVAIAGEQMMLIDNVASVLGCASLDAALTCDTWNDRVLATNEMTGALPLKTIWYATGNNLTIGADTARRTMHIRLESGEENPEERTGFAHPDLLGWVSRERGRLVAAVLTIARAYYLAGRPDQKLPEWGSFEAWSRMVRGAVVWLGYPDPAGDRRAFAQESDRTANELRQLLDGWDEADPDRHGMTVAQALRLLEGSPVSPTADPYPILRAAVEEITPAGKKPNSRSIGMKMSHFRGRVTGGRCFIRESSKMGAVWIVHGGQSRQDAGGTRGTRGTKTDFLAHENKDVKTATGGNSPASPASPPMCKHDWKEESLADGLARVCALCDAFGGYIGDAPANEHLLAGF